jgi:hypothetical protein
MDAGKRRPRLAKNDVAAAAMPPWRNAAGITANNDGADPHG